MKTARSSGRGRFLLRLLFAAFAVVTASFASTAAHAAGTVTIASREPEESDGKWKLKMTINYGSMPHLEHIPMIFAFEPVALYERALTDQSPEKPVLTRIP